MGLVINLKMNPKNLYAGFEEEKLKNLERVVLFHGTSERFIERILEKGLLPWNQNMGHNWDSEGDIFGFFTPQIDCVYFGTFEKAACFCFIVNKKRDAKGVVIEAELDTPKLLPDEDSRTRTWYQSFLSIGSCAHNGIVTPEKIIGVYTAQGKEIWQANAA